MSNMAAAKDREPVRQVSVSAQIYLLAATLNASDGLLHVIIDEQVST